MSARLFLNNNICNPHVLGLHKSGSTSIKEIDRRFAEITKSIEQTANEQYGALQSSIAEMVSIERANFHTQLQAAQELVTRAERAQDIATTNYTTAMTGIDKLDERVKALEAKTK